jgi:hypothetical protein
MITQPSACVEAFAPEDAVLEAAASLWVVLETADELPVTPEGRTRVASGRARLDELLASAGISEEEIRAHLERLHSRCGHRALPSGAARSAAAFRLLQGGSD